MATNQPCGILLVGSINLPTTSEVFNEIPKLLPHRLRRLPDGETGHRHRFAHWQRDVFSATPELLKQYGVVNDKSSSRLAPQQISAALAKLSDIETKYDHYALESYAVFKRSKNEGRIPSITKFQVCLPGIVNPLEHIAPAYRLLVEPRYEEALTRSLYRIQDNIPHNELAIQIDVAIEVAHLEGAPPFVPYFDPIFEGVIERVSRFANRVAPDVELGFHLCYGDAGHQHFVEPKDLGLLVEIANALHKEIKRPIQWLHVPVPKARKDVKYFMPLKDLEWKVPELYLGLVHVNDEEGTMERIATAKQIVSEFGVGTECGMGRTPVEDFGSIMEILRTVSEPVV